MSTGTIIAIVVAVLIVAAVVLYLLPRMRARSGERQLEGRREEVADSHREEAQDRHARAELAEREARKERAEAEVHEARADLHERGMADDELDSDRVPDRDADATPGSDAPGEERRDA